MSEYCIEPPPAGRRPVQPAANLNAGLGVRAAMVVKTVDQGIKLHHMDLFFLKYEYKWPWFHLSSLFIVWPCEKNEYFDKQFFSPHVLMRKWKQRTSIMDFSLMIFSFTLPARRYPIITLTPYIILLYYFVLLFRSPPRRRPSPRRRSRSPPARRRHSRSSSSSSR